MADPISPLTPEQASTAEKHTAEEGYIHRDLVALDQAANVLTGGEPDETISSRLARMDTEDTGVKHEVGKLGSEFLDLFQHDHGAHAEAGDLERAQEVEKIEESTGDVPE